MSGDDWFWLFLMLCVFGYLISREISKQSIIIYKKIEEIESELRLIRSKIES